MRKKKGSGCRVLPDKCFERLAEFSGAFPDRIEGFSLPVNKIPQPLCLLYNPSIEPMLSFQVLNLINEVYSLVQDVALSFRIQEIPGLLLVPFEIRTVECTLDFLKRGIEMPPGYFNGVIRRLIVLPGTMITGQLIDHESLGFPHEPFEISPDKEPGLRREIINVHFGVEDIVKVPEIGGEDRFPCRLVGWRDVQVFFQPARAQEGRVEQVGTVGRPDDKDFLQFFDTIELGQKLGKDAFSDMRGVVHRAPFGEERIDLVKEDNAGRGLPRLPERLPHMLF